MVFENIKNTKDWCEKGYTFSFQSTDGKKRILTELQKPEE